MSSFEVGSKRIGEGHPVYVIAEAGSNHNGSFAAALRLIDVAAEAGADAVKFQNFRAATMYPRTAGESDYLKIPKSIFSVIEEMEMPDSWVPELAAYCRTKSVDFLSTPFDEASVDLLAPHVNVVKIASYEMTHVPLLRHAARLGKPMIVSTGAATLEEVKHAVEVIRKTGNDQVVLLQCTASYPTPLEAVNVRAMGALARATGVPIGISDHSRDPIIVPVAATALGACVIEKHFTLSNRLPGPDHSFAVEPDELALMIRSVRATERALGHGRKETLAEEEELRGFARRSIFSIRVIRAGEALSPENTAILRCGKLGFGLEPEKYEALLGRRAVRDIEAEVLIRLSDVE